MNSERPVNLDLHTVKMPITAIASILHRASAVIIWFGLGIALIALSSALGDEAGFSGVADFFDSSFFGGLILWGLLTALGYYCAGSIKHIIQDMGHFEDMEGGILISKITLGVGAFLSLVAGVWVCF